MLHRIRHNIKDDDATFDDMTQMDETYMGGKSRNHGNGTQGRSLKEKTDQRKNLRDFHFMHII